MDFNLLYKGINAYQFYWINCTVRITLICELFEKKCGGGGVSVALLSGADQEHFSTGGEGGGPTLNFNNLKFQQAKKKRGVI